MRPTHERTPAPAARDDRRRARGRRRRARPRADRARARDVLGDVVGALLLQVVARHLGRFPTEAPWVLVGPGEGAGVIDVGDGLAVAIRIESHNHPSAVEPYQGAATGVGGIIRDIFSMGARPIALMDPLRFGPLDDAAHPLPVRGRRRAASAATATRSACRPSAARSCSTTATASNPLVNVLCLGVLPGRAARARPGRGRRQPRGAARLGDRARRHRRRERARVGRLRRRARGEAPVGAGRRPVRGEAAHRGVPRAARRRARDRRAGPRRGRALVRGVGDRGEDRRGHGRRRRARAQARAGHEPGRGADLGEPGAHARDRHAREPRRRCSRCADGGRSARRSSGASPTPGASASTTGCSTRSACPGANPRAAARRRRRRRCRRTARPSPTCPIGSLGDGPLYHRPLAPPADLAARCRPTIPAPQLRDALPAPAPISRPSCSRCSRRRTSPTSRGCGASTTTSCSSTPWSGRAATPAVLRLKGTPAARSRSPTDGKARFCALDPRTGARLAVLEAARNVACGGARPMALVNCLNFGNPEHPEVMWQFSEVVDGMSEACRALGIPVVGGNVSFYNESRGARHRPDAGRRRGRPDRRARRRCRPAPGCATATAIVLLGETAARARRLGVGDALHGLRGGTPPAADLEVARRAARARRASSSPTAMVTGVHDCSDGGLAVALAEMAIAGGVGFAVALAIELMPSLAGSPSRRRAWCVAVDARPAPTSCVGRARAGRRPARSASATPAATASSPTAPSPSPSPTPTHAWRDAIPSAHRPPGSPLGRIDRESTPWSGG